MSLSTILGYTARAAGQQLEPVTYEAPRLREPEVRVAVTHCGVCHTDIHAVDADFGVFSFLSCRATRSSAGWWRPGARSLG